MIIYGKIEYIQIFLSFPSADNNGFRPKIVWSQTPTTTVAPPTTTLGTDEEGDPIGKQLDASVPQGGFGCPYYFYYNTR